MGSGVFTIQDDGPTANSVDTNPAEKVMVDESQVPPDGDGIVSVTQDYSGHFGTLDNYGTDGAGSVDYVLTLNSNNITGSGLYALDKKDKDATDGDGYGQGAEILLSSKSVDTVEGKDSSGNIYFTIKTDNTGKVTFTQQKMSGMEQPEIIAVENMTTLLS